ncbi:hypothetical protein HYX58_01060 [Candidatus Dependentiae bacterium]|nr:hypothetical protein [Candidatus Dependentiae bacterium]
MNWKEKLKKLEFAKNWDAAIEFMQGAIREDPNNIDKYLFINYLLMNLSVEEEYDKSKQKYYKTLAKWYFDEAYSKFYENPEFLHLTAKTAVMSEWFFGITDDDYRRMLEKAHDIEPQNPLYQESYFYDLESKNPESDELISYAKMILSVNSPIKKQLSNKGALGEYIMELQQGWAQDVLKVADRLKRQKNQN